MKLVNIVNKIASDLMPVGTLIERMVESPFLAIGEKAIVNAHRVGILSGEAIFVNGDYFLPERFRVVKEADR